MDTSLWEKLFIFIKESLSKRFKESLSGFVMGVVGTYPIFLGNVPAELVHTWIGLWAIIKIVGVAYLSSLGTSYASYQIDKLKKKNNEPESEKRSRKKAS